MKISLVIRIIVAVLSFVMLIWVNLNFVTEGTYIGSAVFGAVFLCTVFYEPVSRLVGWVWKSLFGKTVLIGFGVIVAVLTGFCVFFSVRMLQSINNLPEETSAVVVLGCQVNGETPSVMLGKRVNCAYKVLSDNPQAVCVVSGGKGGDELISEAEAMRRRLIEKGISAERIILEDKSESTYENILFSADILKDMGITENIVIVTSEFHQYRAANFAKMCGLETGAYSAATKVANLPNYWVREWAALFHQLVFKT